MLKMLFLLLASYWRGSDVPTPYHVYLKNGGKPSKSAILERISRKLENKTGFAAAVISSCNEVDRLDYIRELGNVDVYGKCGQPCDEEDCFGMIERKYKFYLAFEN